MDDNGGGDVMAGAGVPAEKGDQRDDDCGAGDGGMCEESSTKPYCADATDKLAPALVSSAAMAIPSDFPIVPIFTWHPFEQLFHRI